jgi:hypothetical protein
MDVDIHEPDVSPLQISGPKAGKLIKNYLMVFMMI